MNPNDVELLKMTLELAVPLWIEQLRPQPWSHLRRRAEVCAQTVAEKGDVLQFGGGKKQKGATAEAFNRLAEGLAIMSFSPGGVRAFGLHFVGGHQAITPEARAGVQKAGRVFQKRAATLEDIDWPAEVGEVPPDMNVRWLVLQKLLGRDPKAWEFTSWTRARWLDFAKACGVEFDPNKVVGGAAFDVRAFVRPDIDLDVVQEWFDAWLWVSLRELEPWFVATVEQFRGP